MEERITEFKNKVVTQGLLQPATPSYAASYCRLVLVRRIAEFLISTLLVFGAQQFIVSNHFFSPLWPSIGIALAIIFLRGNFPLLGIFFGTLLSYWLNAIPWHINLIQCTLLVAYAYLIRAIALKTIGAITPLTSNAVLWRFYGLIILLSAIHSLLFFIIMGLNEHMPFAFTLWYAGWLGEINGILCILPFCLMLDPFKLERYFQKSIQLWWVLALVIVICHLSLFIVPPGLPALLLALLFLIILCSYARYFGQIPTGATLLGITIVYLSSVKPSQHFFHPAAESLHDKLLLTLFTLTIMLSLSIATYANAKITAKN